MSWDQVLHVFTLLFHVTRVKLSCLWVTGCIRAELIITAYRVLTTSGVLYVKGMGMALDDQSMPAIEKVGWAGKSASKAQLGVAQGSNPH